MDRRSESPPQRTQVADAARPAPTLDYDYPWIEQFLRQASGFQFTEEQAARIVRVVEDNLHDLFAVAEDTALANGRMVVMLHDLPLTQGLQSTIREHEALAREIEISPALRFLEQSGLAPRYDEMVKLKVAALVGGLLVLTGKIVAIVAPENLSPAEQLERLRRPEPQRPTQWEVERAAQILDLTL